MPSAITALATPTMPCPTGLSAGTYNVTGTFKTFCREAFRGSDIASLIAYSFNDCIDACLSMNYIQRRDVCVAVSIAFNLGPWILTRGDHGNCYLKGLPLLQMIPLQDAWAGALCKNQECSEWYSS